MSEARERILARVRSGQPAATAETALPAPVPVAEVADRPARFAAELEKLGGELIVTDDLRAAAQQLLALAGGEQAAARPWFIADRPLATELGQYLPVQVATSFQLADCLASVTEAEVAVADTATVGLGLDTRQPRACHLLPEIHVVVVRRERLLLTLSDALQELEAAGKLPTAYIFVTGPSRTADIEKTVVIPAHGPKRLIVVMYG